MLDELYYQWHGLHVSDTLYKQNNEIESALIFLFVDEQWIYLWRLDLS